MIKTRPQKKTTSQLTKELDTVFSEFIRLRDADHNGTVTCFVSGEKVFWNDGCDAAHFCNRQHMDTRWLETNVHACTAYSNRWDPDHLEKYHAKMVARYGPEFTFNLQRRAKSTMKFTSTEIIEKIEFYKEEVKKLRALKKI